MGIIEEIDFAYDTFRFGHNVETISEIDPITIPTFDKHLTLVKSILMNSVSNSFKAIWNIEELDEYRHDMEKYNKIEGRIKIIGRSKEPDPYSELIIDDTGHGMTSEQSRLVLEGKYTKRTKTNGGVGLMLKINSMKKINGYV